MAFFQHAPELDACQCRLRRPERFEAQHRSDSPFDKPMILLDNIIEILTLANLDAFVFVNVVLLDAGCIGSAFVDIY